MKCIHCGNEIPERRLRVLPNTQTCKLCSTVEPVHGFRVHSGKNTSEVVIVDPRNAEALRKARRAYEGIRWRGKHNWNNKPV